LGDFKASMESVKEQLPDWTPSDGMTWDDQVEAFSGPVSYEVTVGKDGNWIAEPTS
jgi:hypothetical protein